MCEVSRVAASCAYWFLSVKQEDCPGFTLQLLPTVSSTSSCFTTPAFLFWAEQNWLVSLEKLTISRALSFITQRHLQHISQKWPMVEFCVCSIYSYVTLLSSQSRTYTHKHKHYIISEAVITSGNMWRQSELEKQMSDVVHLMRVFWHANECRCETEHDFHLIYNCTKSSENQTTHNSQRDAWVYDLPHYKI